ncbi:hypothetical protein JM93_04149 [Roseibium hamelinense]|uniref:Uncharacterized protein n=1 Tax=Roseibium hamelinense TaxID=150831 RepID=A0A562SF89_9HYPH|nr:ACT domain-containing protein [Roseibium hamelinense]MTI44180.1 ACT domain-containing protein [Roseibium hamelinense]TWI80037.1 hypothetical protein JM93_04149 [Roseibium hamelinense]
MTGETDLSALLVHMQPELDPQRYVFCTFPNRTMAQLSELEPAGLIREVEGITAILPVERAKTLGFGETGQFRRITLTVHSSLEAVGLTAAISQALAKDGISANVVAGYFHDHVFVQVEKAQNALSVLQKMSATAGS